MPCDAKGNVLKVGDHVVIHGVVKALSEGEPNMYNLTFKTDIGLKIADKGHVYLLSAHMVEKET